MLTARMVEAKTLLSRHIADPSASWSVGEMGVLAEFHHAGASSIDDGARCVRTAGGALRLSPVEEVRILAYETPAACVSANQSTRMASSARSTKSRRS